ncbi:hypothetical protein [Neobacillus bataviensis]|nr:hypothetical protein [Neobacillus bataviensis]
MEKQSGKDNSLETNSNLSLLEQVKRKNLMDWGEIELAESVLNNNTREE